MATWQLLPVFPPFPKCSRQWRKFAAVVSLSGETGCPQNNTQSVGLEVCVCDEGGETEREREGGEGRREGGREGG